MVSYDCPFQKRRRSNFERSVEQLFARFYRAEASRSEETGGTGLGLAIAENALYSRMAV